MREIRIERIIKNHAQMMALVDALRSVVPMTDSQHEGTSSRAARHGCWPPAGR